DDINKVENIVIHYQMVMDEKLSKFISPQSVKTNEAISACLDIIDKLNPGSDRDVFLAFEKMEQILERSQDVTLGDIVEEIKIGLPSLAKYLNKPNPQILTESPGVVFDRKRASALKDILMHCLRNSLDHGLEDEGRRREKGKVTSGQIQIKCHESKDDITLKVLDDGQGLNLKAIEQKARTIDTVPTERLKSDEDIASCIFLYGVSTAKRITEISGRGVGMAAISSLIKSQGGEVDIEFIANRDENGCRPFQLVLRISKNNEQAKLSLAS
ncbi:MAG: hypothetical protein HQK54_17555, partial [Oligoflexales bacterium]|nr:hypothetical protein [Oligoflexales bacterium]